MLCHAYITSPALEVLPVNLFTASSEAADCADFEGSFIC